MHTDDQSHMHEPCHAGRNARTLGWYRDDDNSIGKWKSDDVLEINVKLNSLTPARIPIWGNQQTKSPTLWFWNLMHRTLKNLPARYWTKQQGFWNHAKKWSRKCAQILVPRTGIRSKWPETGLNFRAGNTSKNRAHQLTIGCALNNQKTPETFVQTWHRCKQYSLDDITHEQLACSCFSLPLEDEEPV